MRYMWPTNINTTTVFMAALFFSLYPINRQETYTVLKLTKVGLSVQMRISKSEAKLQNFKFYLLSIFFFNYVHLMTENNVQ